MAVQAGGSFYVNEKLFSLFRIHPAPPVVSLHIKMPTFAGKLPYCAERVVYADIGTSPLYTVGGIWPASGPVPTAEDVIGGISAIIWSLTLVPLIKYVSGLLTSLSRSRSKMLTMLTSIRPASVCTLRLAKEKAAHSHYTRDSSLPPVTTTATLAHLPGHI